MSLVAETRTELLVAAPKPIMGTVDALTLLSRVCMSPLSPLRTGVAKETWYWPAHHGHELRLPFVISQTAGVMWVVRKKRVATEAGAFEFA